MYITSDSDGIFAGTISSPATGYVQNRVTYDGNSQYAPSVSNEVVTTRANGVTGILHVQITDNQYAPAISNTVTLTVINMAISQFRFHNLANSSIC